MNRIIKCLSAAMMLITGWSVTADAQTTYRDAFLNPSDENRPLIIWQWMDGLVTKEGITKDLEAFKAAGLAGVQNFQIGGDRQSLVGDPTCAIGSDKWKAMMRWAMEECKRLGLSFGTHNCPGWSSSAYGNVTPEYSMQKLVYSETMFDARKKMMILPRPEVDSKYNYYEDVAVLAMPADSTVNKNNIIDITEFMNADGVLTIPRQMAAVMKTHPVVLRFGHTTNGKTNEAQSPVSGQGLECDKMRREAVKHFWDGYPQMLIDIAGDMAGNTFNRIEIDSYEAGGQDWSVVLPEEFRSRKGYDLMPYLPAIVGRAIIGSKEENARFIKDFTDVLTSLFAENYYGYMTELVEQTPGLKLMIEPYGTGGQKPFRVLDIYKILKHSPNAIIATEFWVKPNWGWKDMIGHEKVMRNTQRTMLVAEAFTCWPLHAWKDGPQSLKPICDRAFCTGVNRMMLHAGAANPWPNVEPGMSFGIWGTQFVPGQTWWKAGGARALFDYMARCQSLLQRGVPAKDQIHITDRFKTYRRTDGANDILFICNPTDNTVADTLRLAYLAGDRSMELWDPYSVTMNSLPEKDNIIITIEPNGSRFIIISRQAQAMTEVIKEKTAENALLTDSNNAFAESIMLDKGWSLSFPSDKEPTTIITDTLFDWTSSSMPELKYFSGTATYTRTVTLKKKQLNGRRAVLSLGKVKNMATVRVNGKGFPVMWKAPFLLDITSALRNGNNTIEIDVTNLWPNRMIGDEHEPDDIEWSEPFIYSYAPGSPVAGRFMKSIPDWLRNGTPRPSKGRKTVGCFKFFTADSPLLPSGLLGPVSIKFE
ncbi:MAG: hypothetical protein J6B91_03265 [Prevotella sp.]|nr:hypothetical protein [Prevotella sp.]